MRTVTATKMKMELSICIQAISSQYRIALSNVISTRLARNSAMEVIQEMNVDYMKKSVPKRRRKIRSGIISGTYVIT